VCVYIYVLRVSVCVYVCECVYVCVSVCECMSVNVCHAIKWTDIFLL